MNAKWKRNTVIATMAVLVCAAVALNWKYSGEDAVKGAQETGSKLLGEATLVSGQEGDGTVVVRTVYPTYRGALVVCQGGDRPEVKLAVTEAVAALTGLSADRVTVAKWQ